MVVIQPLFLSQGEAQSTVYIVHSCFNGQGEGDWEIAGRWYNWRETCLDCTQTGTLTDSLIRRPYVC